jgi:hypothetical protein
VFETIIIERASREPLDFNFSFIFFEKENFDEILAAGGSITLEKENSLKKIDKKGVQKDTE